MERIALVGGGLIGQAWAIVFGRAGHEVMLYDAEPAALKQARDAIAARLADLAGFRLVDDPHAILGRIGYATGSPRRWTAPPTSRRARPSGSR